jgi:hypothetical protein
LSSFLARPLRSLLIALGLLLVVAVPSASAASHFAAPGGIGGAPCDQKFPCSLKEAVAVAKAGDDVVIEPGNYSTAAGDFTSVTIGPGISIHGRPGAPRPVLTTTMTTPVFFVNANATLAHVEVGSDTSQNPLFINGGTVEGVVARTGKEAGVACTTLKGVLRNSVCLSSGTAGVAVGAIGATAPIAPETVQLRGVTAVATGTASAGVDFDLVGEFPFPNGRTIDATGLIAHGVAADVIAHSESPAPHTPGKGAEVNVVLDHSDYATVVTSTDGGGTATVTPAGSGTNITAPALLAADGFHQLPGSPTIDKGAVNALSGATDIDEEARIFNASADIGADELQVIPALVPAPGGSGTSRKPGKGGANSGGKAPNTTRRKKPKTKTAATAAKFTFVSDKAHSSFQCKLDRKPFKPCRSPFKATKLKPGSHTFKVRAVAAGAADPTPATFRWKVAG